MTEPTGVRTPMVPESRRSGENDPAFIELWLGAKVSAHTRRAYAADADQFLAFEAKPL